MQKIIYANHQHEILIQSYINLTHDLISEISSDSKFAQYLEIHKIIIDYHNEYGKTTDRQNWFDWIMIIPINLSVMTNGFLAGLENKKNTRKIFATRNVLNDLLQDTVNKIDLMEFKNE